MKELLEKKTNRKIINATPTEERGILFKSKLESSLFKYLQEEGFNPQYEPVKYHIWEGYKPLVPFYIKDKKTKSLKLDTKKIIDITYCPDIVFKYGKYTVFIEVKPDYMNDVFPYKRKLFRKYLEEKQLKVSDFNPIYAQIGTKKNLMEFIRILKENYNEKS